MTFFSHPKSVCMSYIQHFCFSMEIAYIFLISSLQAIIHAFYPDVYITSTSNTIIFVEQKLKNSGCK